MRDHATFEARLADAFDRYAAAAPVAVDAREMARALAAGGGSRAVGARRARPSMLLAAALLAVLAAVAGVIAGAWLLAQERTLPGRLLFVDPMHAKRDWAAGAVLPDGRVLVVGGTTQDGAPALGEIYDPTTRTWDWTRSPMSSGRIAPTATTLADGRVLVAGGGIDGLQEALVTADLFDPGTGAFTPTGQMNHPRTGHTATLLADGRVLVAGGATFIDGNPFALRSAEVFDPATGTWTEVASLPEQRVGHAAVALRDGRVLIVGGAADGGGPAYGPSRRKLASAIVVDPATGSTAEVGALSEGRSEATATLLRDGRVLVAGGNAATPDDPTEDVALASAELFDPATGTFSPTGSLTTERYRHAATLLPSGEVLVTGGSNAHGRPLSAELYDPGTGRFRQAATATGEHAELAALLPDGGVLLVDGERPELFDPAGTTAAAAPSPIVTGPVATAGPVVTARSDHTATKLPDGRVLIVGGRASEDFSILASAEVFDPATDTFTETGPLGQPRAGHAAVLLADGRVLVAGGVTTGDSGLATTEVYDPATGAFTAGPTLPVPADAASVRWLVRPARLPDGGVLLVGPWIGRRPWGEKDAMASMVTEIDGSASSATRRPDLDDCAVVDAAALRERILVLCLTGDRRNGAAVRLYDPATASTERTWSVPGSFPSSGVALLPDGRVLIAGTGGSTGLAILDPRVADIRVAGLGAASAVLPETVPGEWIPAMLRDGRVLLVSVDAAWEWDPATDATTRLATLDARRFDPTLTLLDDGRVLVVGGAEWPADRTVPRPPGAELIDPPAGR